ncbi:MAG TPA: ABC transporter ATP-binding protein [Dehalococcoidales bacterium]
MIELKDIANHPDIQRRAVGPMIELKDITKSYPMGKRQLKVLQGVNLKINKGEMVAIMGPSGSGKTTILNMIGLLDRPTSGSYLLEDKEVSKLGGGELAKIRAQKIGFIFQTFNLLPYLSAIANVELGQKYAGKLDPKVAKEALIRVGLGDRMKHRPGEMSGGEQQRVAVARALAKDPPLILADEPTGNLDSHSGKEVMSILTSLHTDNNITLVMITHDVNIARYCQRVIHIQDGLVLKEELI